MLRRGLQFDLHRQFHEQRSSTNVLNWQYANSTIDFRGDLQHHLPPGMESTLLGVAYKIPPLDSDELGRYSLWRTAWRNRRSLGTDHHRARGDARSHPSVRVHAAQIQPGKTRWVVQGRHCSRPARTVSAASKIHTESGHIMESLVLRCDGRTCVSRDSQALRHGMPTQVSPRLPGVSRIACPSCSKRAGSRDAIQQKGEGGLFPRGTPAAGGKRRRYPTA